MRSWRTIVIGLAVVATGAAAVWGNPLPTCDWESGETVLGFYGAGLIATNALPPEPDPYSPMALQLELTTPSDPLPAAQIAWVWAGRDRVGADVAFTYAVEHPGEVEWRLQARWNDSLPADPQADDGDAGGTLLAAGPGWNWVDFPIPSVAGHRGLVVTVTPVVPMPGRIWIDLLMLDGQDITVRTPCDQWVAAESRRLGEIKSLFH